MSVRRRGIAKLDPFQVGLLRATAPAILAGLPDYHAARLTFIEIGAAWLWREHREHVRALPPDAQLALVDDAYASDKRTASAMLAELFPAGGAGPVVGL